MALIKCPECGKEISDKAITCPNCGTPIAEARKIKVHFWRKKAFGGSYYEATVSVDGMLIGAIENGSSFDVMLSPGQHNVVIASKVTGFLASDRTTNGTIEIPDDAKSVDVEIMKKLDAVARFGGGGVQMVIGEVIVNR